MTRFRRRQMTSFGMYDLVVNSWISLNDLTCGSRKRVNVSFEMLKSMVTMASGSLMS